MNAKTQTINVFKHLFQLLVSPNISIDWHHLWDGRHSWNRPLAIHIPPSRTCVPTNSHFEPQIHIAIKCMLTCEDRLKEWHWCQRLNNVMPNTANIQKKEPCMASNCLTSTLIMHRTYLNFHHNVTNLATFANHPPHEKYY